jgi:hypothetical protein
VAQEGKMGKINWGRVVLCGFLTGVVWGVLYAIALPLVGRDFLAALPGGHDIPATLPGGHHIPGTTPSLRAIVMIMPLALGIWTMWLYAAIRPRYGPGPKTAAVAGFALWFIGSGVDAVWAAFGAVPLGVLVGPVAANLPITLVAAVVGAWPYKE